MPQASHLHGLSQADAAARLAEFGPNLLRKPKTRTLARILVDTLREPMLLLLLAAAGLYLVVGDLHEGLFMATGALLALGLVIVQEARSEHALQALNALAEPRARVVRDGRPRWIAARDLVPGDLLMVSEGARIPADAILLEGGALEVDESALTGESAPVSKRPGEVEAAALESPGDEATPALFAATLVLQGHGVARVLRTGAATQVGRIGATLGEIVQQPTLVQRDVRRMVRRIGLLALLFCMLVALLYGLVRRDWFSGAVSGLTLSISLIPEEFPMVLTIFMALGALRLARQNVLVRRSAVIETLGATDLLCVDKTGTITENRMKIRYAWLQGDTCDLRSGIPDAPMKVVEAARRASTEHGHDPMDAAINSIAAPVTAKPIRTYPLSPNFLAFVQVWREPTGETIYSAKGAHEALLPLCRDSPKSVEAAERAAHELAIQGARVLAIAEARFTKDPQLDADQVSYELVGLLGFEDPVRSDVPEAIRRAAAAGVTVAMITGDYPATARSIAASAGFDVSAGVLAGAEIGKLDEVPADVRVFARVKPEQKLRLVEAFRRAGHVVSMTGDGINDAPALAAADVGIAMGLRGTDVARESADLILLDDRFATILAGIELGRRIFANLRRAMTYVTAVHVPVAGLALLPLLLGLPPMFYPMHLVLLELLFDPLCSIVFEADAPERDAMTRPPRPIGESLFGARQIALAIVQGAVLLGVVLAYYVHLNGSGEGEKVARTLAFIALVAGQLSLAVANGSRSARLFSRPRIVFWAIVGAALLMLAGVLTSQFFLQLFRFAQPSGAAVATAVAVGLAAGGWTAALRVPRIQSFLGDLGRASQSRRSFAPARLSH